MKPAYCPKCGHTWFTLRAAWHTRPKFTRIPTGTVDLYYRCTNCGSVMHETKELQESNQTNEGGQNAPC